MNRIFCVFAGIFLKCSLLVAQSPYFEQYHPLKKGVPVEVKALLQDSKGFIWLGTGAGLFRFDGTEYLQFNENDSLPDIEVTALAEDSLGRIWMGHRNGHLSYLEEGKVSRFETREGPAIKPVSDILFDRQGRMWFSTLDDGVYYYRNDRLFRLDEEEGFSDLFIYDLHEDDDGNIWAGTDGGLAKCTLGDSSVTVKVFAGDHGLPDIIIKKIKRIGPDTLSLATEDAGVVMFNTRTYQSVALATPWLYGSVSDHVIKQNQIWIAARGSGLVVCDRVEGSIKVYGESAGQSLRTAKVLLTDLEGNIWAGLRTGLVRTMGDAVELIESLEPCTDTDILALAVDQRERIWFSSKQGLFIKAKTSEGASTVSRALQNTPYEKEMIISLFADNQGYIWAGLYGNGLLRIDPTSYRVKHYRSELRNGNVLSISGAGDNLWIATLGGGTLLRRTGDDYQATNYSSADGLSSDFVYQAFIDSRGRVWFGTDGKGVTMLDSDGFHHIEEGLKSKVVYSFAEDTDGNIWVSAQDNGVFLFENGRFKTVPEVRLRDNGVQLLTADNLGHLIVMHNFGVDVFDIRRKKMRYWGEESGIRDKRPNLNAVAKDQRGQIFMGTSQGIVKLSLRNDTAFVVPKPVIDQVKLYDEVIHLHRNPRLLHNENNLTLHFLGFWYHNTENLTYMYKLENYDLEWIETRNQQVTYSRLPPGEYVFKVRVSATEDFQNAAETTVTFAISPPFWRTGTFYVFVIGLFVIGAYLLMKFRERKLLEDKLILEAKVAERTREIQMKTEEIQAQNEEILAQAEEIQGINENLEMLVKQRTAELEKKNQALEEYAFINAHKLRGPVASILGLLNLLQKSNPKDDQKVLCTHLQESAQKLDAVVRSITKAIEKADNKYL